MRAEPVMAAIDTHIRMLDADKDAQELRDLYAVSLSANRAGFIQDSAAQPLADIAEIAAHFSASGGGMLGLFTGNRLIGFGGICRHETPQAAELCKLHLHPAYQGRGLGRRLVDELLQLARTKGFDDIVLHVTATQVAALGLYIRLGFKQTHRAIYTAPDGSTYDTIYMHRPVDMPLAD